MARRKWVNKPTTNFPRTIERIAIAAFATITARGENPRVTVIAFWIFVLVVVVEELGRTWIWKGRRVSVRDVAFASVGKVRLWLHERFRGRKKRRKRAARGKRHGAVIPGNDEQG